MWNAINFKPDELTPDPSKSAAVEPRTLSRRCARPLRHLSYAEDASWAPTRIRLSAGRQLQGWYAPNITADTRKGIGRWSVEDIVTYLKTGANRDTLASGGMGEEVVHSSSHMTDDDLKAIAVYLLSLKPASQAEPAAACRRGRAHGWRVKRSTRTIAPAATPTPGRVLAPLSAPCRQSRGAVG